MNQPIFLITKKTGINIKNARNDIPWFETGLGKERANNKEEKIFVQDTEITIDKLVPKLISISKNRNDRKIFIRADEILSYGRVVEVMAVITSAGFNKIALVTDLEINKWH